MKKICYVLRKVIWDIKTMEIKTKFNIKDYVKIIPLEGIRGRIISIAYDGADISYKVEFYADSSQNQIFVFEDEIQSCQ